jgi:hypothetical protein
LEDNVVKQAVPPHQGNTRSRMVVVKTMVRCIFNFEVMPIFFYWPDAQWFYTDQSNLKMDYFLCFIRTPEI